MENPSSVAAAPVPPSAVIPVTWLNSNGHWQVFRGKFAAGKPTGFKLTPQNLNQVMQILKLNSALPVIIQIYIAAIDNIWDDYVFTSTGAAGCTSKSRSCTCLGSSNCIAYYSVLDAAISSFLPYAVFVVKSAELSWICEVIAVNCACNSSEILEASFSWCYAWVIATVLRNLIMWKYLLCHTKCMFTLTLYWLLVESPNVKDIVASSVLVQLRST